MKLQEIKLEVFKLTGIPNTKELKIQRADLTNSRDLRYKAEWQAIHAIVYQQREQLLSITLEDLEKEDIALKQSLHRIGRITGLSFQEVEKTWDSIQAKNIDIVIENA